MVPYPFGVRNFGNTLAISVIFFKSVQNLICISKIWKKIQEKFFVFEIIASELVVLNCLY